MHVHTYIHSFLCFPDPSSGIVLIVNLHFYAVSYRPKSANMSSRVPKTTKDYSYACLANIKLEGKLKSDTAEINKRRYEVLCHADDTISEVQKDVEKLRLQKESTVSSKSRMIEGSPAKSNQGLGENEADSDQAVASSASHQQERDLKAPGNKPKKKTAHSSLTIPRFKSLPCIPESSKNTISDNSVPNGGLIPFLRRRPKETRGMAGVYNSRSYEETSLADLGKPKMEGTRQVKPRRRENVASTCNAARSFYEIKGTTQTQIAEEESPQKLLLEKIRMRDHKLNNRIDNYFANLKK